MRIGLVILITVSAALVVYLAIDLGGVASWAVEQQRGFQNQMANAVRALHAEDTGAYLLLFVAAGAYGFVHALGPGHGKYLVGGIGLGSGVSATRLASIAVASSIVQAVWAILLVYGGFFLLEATANRMTELAEDVLAPASYLAIAAVGLLMAWRGLGRLVRTRSAVQSHTHTGEDCGCHSHGPSPEDVAKLGSLREAIFLVLSVAIRPCTGAIFLLVIAWQMDLRSAGVLAVLIMGLGTAGLTSLVAISSIAARQSVLVSSKLFENSQIALPAIQIFAGILIAVISSSFLRIS